MGERKTVLAGRNTRRCPKGPGSAARGIVPLRAIEVCFLLVWFSLWSDLVRCATALEQKSTSV